MTQEAKVDFAPIYLWCKFSGKTQSGDGSNGFKKELYCQRTGVIKPESSGMKEKPHT